MNTVLVVEDDPAIQLGLEKNLRYEGYQVITASEGETGYAIAMERRPDCILLDVMLPKLSGFDVCRQLRRQGYVGPIIMLTAKDQDIDKVMGLDLGADDYITKPFSVAEVVARVNAAVRRSKRYDSQPVDYTFGSFSLDIDGQVLKNAQGQVLELSQKEFQILRLFVENEGKVLQRKDILDRVWGYGYDGTDRTVDNFINKLRQKVEVDPANPSFILTMRGAGYKFVRAGGNQAAIDAGV